MSVCLAEAPLDDLLKGVEAHYNQAKTLQVLFRLDYTAPGKPRRSENGILLLRKPLRMRWDYSQPKGKLIVCDAKNLWTYMPEDKEVRKTSMKETEDMRAPLAFLLGKLHFQKEFQNLKATSEGAVTRITAEPKGDNLPYSRVEFLVSSDRQIRELKVEGFDKSVMDFTFDQERLNPSLDPKLFQFQPPPGVQVLEGQ